MPLPVLAEADKACSQTDAHGPSHEVLLTRAQVTAIPQCLRMTRNVSEAEDLTQDVFLQLYRKLKTFRGESAFTTWLHRLTMNVVLMHFRKTSVRPDQRTDRLPEQLEIASRGAGSESSVILNRIYLDEALRQLSPGYRAVLILHDVEGYEHNQIGAILGCAVGTSKSQLHKARKKLRRLLKKRTAQGVRVGKLQLRYV